MKDVTLITGNPSCCCDYRPVRDRQKWCKDIFSAFSFCTDQAHYFKNIVLSLCLLSTSMLVAQSSDCIPGQVQNDNTDPWSEQCYLAPDCQEQGNPCQANDITLLGAYVGDVNGGPVPACSAGEQVTVYLWATFENNTNTNRYAVRTTTELYLNGVFSQALNSCSFDVLVPGISEVALIGAITYTCGMDIQLLNTWIGWSTSAGQCSDPNGDDYNVSCGQYPPSKCSKELGFLQFLVPNFSYTCGDQSNGLQTEVCFTNLSEGGTGALTYAWDFGDASTSTATNPCHIYAATSGTYTVNLTATDANGISASVELVVDLANLGCCFLTLDCPDPDGGFITCIDELPHPDNSVVVTDSCGTATIQIEDSFAGSGCGTDTMFITRLYTVTDGTSTATCTRVFSMVDNTAPVLVLAGDESYSCTSEIPAPNLPAMAPADICGGAVAVSLAPDVTINYECANTYTLLRTFIATDVCGNSASFQQSIMVADIVEPILSVPSNITVTCPSLIPLPDLAAVSFSDNCTGSVVITVAPDVTTNVTCANNFVIHRTYTGTDACGNAASDTQLITVQNLAGPSITCPINITVSCASLVPPANIASVVTSDICGGTVTVSVAADVVTNVVCANNYTITRIYTAVDGCGNAASCSQTIRVLDNTQPVITCPANLTVNCASLVPAANVNAIVTTDNCGGAASVTVSADVTTSLGCANNYLITRTYTSTDACGNSASCAQLITVVDNTAPSIVCPGNVTVTCAGLVPASNTASIVTTDNCGSGAVVVTVAADVTVSLGCANHYAITRVYTATDACGNTATCAQSITVNDTTSPTITCPVNITVSCASLVPAANIGAVIASDNCGGTVTVSVASDVITGLVCANNYTINRIYSAVDGCGNATSCTQTIRVLDNTLPTITCPANVTVNCASLVPAANVNAVVTNDNCGGAASVTVSADVTTSLGCANNYLITRTYTSTDACGNSATCAQLISVLDNTAPSIVCPANVTVSCAGLVPAANIAAIVTTDNCGNGAVVVTVAADVTVSLGCANHYTITRVYTATDACGNTTTCAQSITVNDTTPPTITCPVNITVSCASLVPVANIGAVIASDICDGTVTVSVTADVVTNVVCANNYTITRIYTALDGCGNSTSCSQTIQVLDNTLPTITCPANVTVNCATLIPAANVNAIVTADNCGGAVTVSVSADVTTSLGCVNNFLITRTYTSIDACGNSATCAQLISVLDNTAPSITCLADVTVSCAGLVPASNIAAIITTDNCGAGAVVVTVAPDVTVSLGCANHYGITRVYTATDACGNIATCAQSITVNDTTPPTIACPAAIAVACASLVPAADVSSIITSDLCGGTVTVTAAADVTINFVCTNQYSLQRVYTATDACGNTATCAQTISVSDTIAPSITCPANITLNCTGVIPSPDTAGVVAIDNCTGAVTISHISDDTVGVECNFSINRTFAATDACGNAATCVQIITFIDTTAPVLLFVDPLLAGLQSGDTLYVQCYGQDSSWTVPQFDENSVAVSDSCSAGVPADYIEAVQASGNCDSSGYIAIYNLQWSAVDACGNTVTALIYMTLIDTIPPVIIGVPADVTVSADSIPLSPAVSATDECLCACVMLLEESSLPEGCLDGQVLTRTWSAMDQCGNIAYAVQHITIIDIDGPALVMELPGVPAIHNGQVLQFACEQGGLPAAMEGMNEHTVEFLDASGPVHMNFDVDYTRPDNCDFFGYVEQAVYSWEAVDACGNTSAFSFTIQLTDNTAPVISNVPVMTCIDDPSLRLIEAADGCTEASLRFWDVAVPNPCGQGTAMRRTYESFDACGNMSRDTVILVPDDATPPVMEFINPELVGMTPGDFITVECHRDSTHYTNFSSRDVSITDGCAEGVRVDFDEKLISSDDCTDGNVGLLELRWTATDHCGNFSTMVIMANVLDNTPPSFVNFHPEVTIGCRDTMPAVRLNDNCGSVTVAYSDTTIPGPCEFQYDIKRLITATDQCGNSAQIGQLIHVGKNDGPQIDGVVNVVCDDLTLPEVSGFDHCAGVAVNVTMVQDTLEDTCRDGMVITRTWSATDVCNHTSTITQYIYVGDTVAPQIIIPANSIIRYILDLDTVLIVHMSDRERMDALNALNANSIQAFDNCDLEINPVFTLGIALPSNALELGYTEHRLYSWVVEDACGNKDSIQFPVNIIDDIPPVTELPNDTVIYCSPLPPVLNMIPQDSNEVVTVVYTEVIADGHVPGEFLVTRTWIVTDVNGNSSVLVQHITWIPSTFLSCDILTPLDVECNSHGVLITSQVSGGVDPLTYHWEITGEACFIQAGQNTPEILIYVGWSDVHIRLIVTDQYGCTTFCETTVSCGAEQVALVNGSGSAVIAESALLQAGNKAGNLESINVMPNPAKDNVFLNFDSYTAENMEVTMINSLGYPVFTEKFESAKGFNSHEMNLRSLPDGLYIIQIKSLNTLYTRRLVISN